MLEQGPIIQAYNHSLGQQACSKRLDTLKPLQSVNYRILTLTETYLNMERIDSITNEKSYLKFHNRVYRGSDGEENESLSVFDHFGFNKWM